MKGSAPRSPAARTARVIAHAKINLILRVLAREESGFHSLETLFARLDLGDVVTVRVGGVGASRSVDCDREIPGPPEQNLAYRAALAFAEATGWPAGFAIEIEKHIPMGGGLGGGSADAGAVLRALAALSPHQVRGGQLLAIAAALGSDVPYLTTAAPLALAWGRGERMLALPPLPEATALLVIPPFPVSTAAAYAWLAASRAEPAPGTSAAVRSEAPPAPPASPPRPAARSHSPSPRLPQLLSPADFATWHSIAPLATNDFEPVVFPRHPEIAEARAALRAAGASIALMSGSGSTVFGIFASDAPVPPVRIPHPIRTRTLTSVSPVELE